MTFYLRREAQRRYTRSSFYKGQAIRDDIKIFGKYMGQLKSNSKNVWDSKKKKKHTNIMNFLLICFPFIVYFALNILAENM